MDTREVVGVVGLVLLGSCTVMIAAGWTNSRSTFLRGLIQTRDPKSVDPARDAAAVCWLVLGATAGWLAWVLPGPEPVRYVLGALAAAGAAVAAWVRFADAPAALRPTALRRRTDQS